MIVTFTGSQKGLSSRQVEWLTSLFLEEATKPSLLIHGGCIGADSDVDKLAIMLMVPREIYPSNIEAKRARIYHGAGVLVKVHEPMNPLERNRLMVDRADGVIACPGEENEVLRSGTWATIRYARRKLGEAGVIVLGP